MKIKEEQRHFLSLQSLPGDNRFIDISKLGIANNFNPTTLAEIDSFTMHFTTEQIIDAIKEANIVEEKYLQGTLCICDNQKHNPIIVISKDFLDEFNIEQFLTNSFGNKNLINTIMNKFKALSEDELQVEMLKNALQNSAIEQALHVIFNTPYLIQRKFIIYLIELYKKEKSIPLELTRDKAA